MIKILSLNTWQERGPWRERWEIIFSELKRHDPDIIGFQEVFNMDWADEVRRRSGYPHLVKSGKNSGLIFLSKFPVLKTECLTYQAKSPSEDYMRYALFSLFDMPAGPAAGFNTHLSWKIPEEDIRSRQTAELLRWAAHKASGGLKRLFRPFPAFLLGDFNAAPNTPSVEAVQQVWQDSFKIMNPGNPGLTWDYRNPFAARASDRMPERRIDYIWTKGFKKVKRSEIVCNRPDTLGIYASDHFGVLSEVEI